MNKKKTEKIKNRSYNIEWSKNKNCHFMGRNGFFSCCGINLFRPNYTPKLCITPITSKDKFANCRIEIPVSLSILNDLISQIQEIVDEITHQTPAPGPKSREDRR